MSNTKITSAVIKDANILTAAIADAAVTSAKLSNALSTKIDGIEASADVTDATNVTAAGALMDSELTSIVAVKALNQGVATGDSPTFAAVTATNLKTTDFINIQVDDAQLYFTNAANNRYNLFERDASNNFYLKRFDGSSVVTDLTFNSAGAASFNGVVTIPVGSVGAPSLTFAGDSDTGIFHRLANTIDITTGGTLRLEIDSAGNFIVQDVFYAQGGAVFNEGGVDADFRVEAVNQTHALFVEGSSGNVGINNANPNAPLAIQTESGTGSKSGLRLNNAFGFNNANTGCEIIFSQDRSASEDFKMAAIVSGQTSTGSSAHGHLGFYTRLSSSIAERVRIHHAGTISASAGITLGAGLNDTAANTLDDYEEGTWASRNGTTGTNCSNLSHSDSYYTKVGRLVTLSFNVAGTITSTGAETVIKFNLPFTAINSSNQGAGGTANFFIGSGADRFGLGLVFNGTTASATSHIYIPSNQLNASGQIVDMRVFMSYMTA